MNPPGHHPDAKDFVAVNGYGAPYEWYKVLRHCAYKLNVTETYAWGKDVFSPFEGVVLNVENGVTDRTDLNLLRDLLNGLVLAPRRAQKGIRYFLGNHVVIQSGDGVLALFAHLKQGSVVVIEGQSVGAGELIGQVGNSGNTIQPHLHFQLTRERDLSRAIPIPFVFEYRRIGDKPQSTPQTGLPGNFERFRV